MKLVSSNDKILTTKCEDFDFENPPFDPIAFSHELIKFMYENNGMGICANQIGLGYRIFALRATPENFVIFNPRIVGSSTQQVVLEESCLSFKGLVVKVKRPQHIRMRFQTPNGETMTKQFTGITARCVQHEIDHLNGILFYNKANRFHRETALRKWKNL